MHLVNTQNTVVVQYKTSKYIPVDTLLPFRVVKNYELDFITGSTGGHIVQNDKIYSLSPGMLFFRKPGTKVQGSTSYSAYCLYFSIEQMNFELPEMMIMENSAKILEYMEILYKASKEPALPFEYMHDYYVNAIFYEMLNQTDFYRKPQKSDSKLVMAYHEMKKNYKKDFALSYYAEIAGYSVSHFSTLFHEIYHMPPMQYILNLRIADACRKLTETDDPVRVIAVDTGFRSESYFYRQFQKSTGMSPVAYRKAYRYN